MNENDRKQIQDLLDSQKTQAERNRLGQFSTPFSLAVDIMKYARERLCVDHISFLEPAIGTGVFYSAFLSVFGESISHRALGFEIDEHYFTPTAQFWRDSALEMRNADFLEQPPEKDFSLLVANPPYSRHHHLSAEKKHRLQQMVFQSTGIKISQLAGLYCYFLILSSQWLKENALSCWLIPSEFMDVNFGQAVKQFLLNNVNLVQIHRFSPENQQFSDALITSSIVIFENRLPSDQDVIFSSGGSILAPEKTVKYDRLELERNAKWSPLFSQEKVNSSGLTIGDFFLVKRGLVTGGNDFFILDEKTVKERQIPEIFLTPILPSPRYVFSDQIESENGILSQKHHLFLFSCELSESEIKENYPKLWEYIQYGAQKGIPDGYICRNRTPWYSCEKRRPAPFVVPYMGRNDGKHKIFRFILNNSTALASNVYLLLYPRPQYEEKFQSRSNLSRIWKALNEIPKDQLINNGRVYGGGLHKLEPKELMNAPASTIADILGISSLPKQELLF